MTAPEVTVERVRLHADALDTDAGTARLRLGNLLSGAELRPRGLPPSAVLCVRRLADPLPGLISLDSAELRPPPEWEHAFVEALTRILRTAARPAREAVPANAEAVLFADRAELLACLARDARDGTAWTRWWWRSLRATAAPGSDPVIAAWLAAPEHVPAALALLATRGEAAAFVAALPVAAAASLAERVATVFGAAELRRAIASAGLAVAERPRPAAGAPATASAVTGEPPWRALIPETVERPLVPRRELLLGVALALRRVPVLARSPSFAAAVREWLEAPASAPPPARRPTVVRPASARRDRAAVTTAPSPAATAAPPAAGHEPVHSPPLPPRRDEPESRVPALESVPQPHPASPTTADEPTPATARPETTSVTGKQSELQPARQEQREPIPEPPPLEQSAAISAAPPALSPRRAAEPPPPSAGLEPEDEPPALVVESELGGVFYLLNLALFLGLYGDFTRPLEPGIALDPWKLLGLLARRLLGGTHRDDPLWSLLERLAGPSAFRPPRVWRAPGAWLEPFSAEGEWRWSASRGRLRLVHAAGFTVLSVARSGEPARTQLERELRTLRLRPASLRRAALPAEPLRPLARWTAWLASYADARLRLALALGPGDSLAELLLVRRARVFVTATHVDVVLRLASLPLEVRFAGLDRTPGWIPAAGRFVSFHFE